MVRTRNTLLRKKEVTWSEHLAKKKEVTRTRPEHLAPSKRKTKICCYYCIKIFE